MLGSDKMSVHNLTPTSLSKPCSLSARHALPAVTLWCCVRFQVNEGWEVEETMQVAEWCATSLYIIHPCIRPDITKFRVLAEQWLPLSLQECLTACRITRYLERKLDRVGMQHREMMPWWFLCWDSHINAKPYLPGSTLHPLKGAWIMRQTE